MSTTITIRDYRPDDATSVNRVALEAWNQYASAFSNWDKTAQFVGNVASLATELELIVAEMNGDMVGVVGYVPPHGKREEMFPPEWAIIRMLSVVPRARGGGLGRQLSQECITRARRDGATAVGLHTSPVMKVALPLYLRMGFIFERTIPDRNGIPYALYKLALSDKS